METENKNQDQKENQNWNTLGAPDLDEYFRELMPYARKRLMSKVPIPQLLPAPVLRRYLKMLWLWGSFLEGGEPQKAARQLRRIKNYEKKLYRNYSPLSENSPTIDTLFGSISLAEDRP